jgi:hypothetical protein
MEASIDLASADISEVIDFRSPAFARRSSKQNPVNLLS